MHRVFKQSGQRGFTFVELLMAMMVTAMIAAAAGATIHQLMTSNTRHTNHMVAVKQVENALHFIARDVQQAQTIEIAPDPVAAWPDPVMHLEWTDWDDTDYTVEYRWDPATQKLDRDYAVGTSSGNTTRISRYIASLAADRPSASEVRVTISSRVGNGLPETRTVQINPRTGS